MHWRLPGERVRPIDGFCYGISIYMYRIYIYIICVYISRLSSHTQLRSRKRERGRDDNRRRSFQRRALSERRDVLTARARARGSLLSRSGRTIDGSIRHNVRTYVITRNRDYRHGGSVLAVVDGEFAGYSNGRLPAAIESGGFAFNSPTQRGIKSYRGFIGRSFRDRARFKFFIVTVTHPSCPSALPRRRSCPFPRPTRGFRRASSAYDSLFFSPLAQILLYRSPSLPRDGSPRVPRADGSFARFRIRARSIRVLVVSRLIPSIVDFLSGFMNIVESRVICIRV